MKPETVGMIGFELHRHARMSAAPGLLGVHFDNAAAFQLADDVLHCLAGKRRDFRYFRTTDRTARADDFQHHTVIMRLGTGQVCAAGPEGCGDRSTVVHGANRPEIIFSINLTK